MRAILDARKRDHPHRLFFRDSHMASRLGRNKARVLGVEQPGEECDWHGQDVSIRDVYLRAGCDNASPA